MKHLFLFLALLLAATANAQSLRFNGSGQHITLGNADVLKLSSFTLEAWVRPKGAGVATNSGQGSITVYPLPAEGRAAFTAVASRSEANRQPFVPADDNEALNKLFTVSPNPATGGKITISLLQKTGGSVTVELYDMAGAIRHRQTSVAGNIISISPQLAAGVYTLVVRVDKKEEKQKVMVQ